MLPNRVPRGGGVGVGNLAERMQTHLREKARVALPHLRDVRNDLAEQRADLGVGGCPLDQRHETRVGLRVGQGEHILLGGEMEVEGAAAHADPRCDLVDARRLHPVTPKDIERSGEQLAPRFLPLLLALVALHVSPLSRNGRTGSPARTAHVHHTNLKAPLFGPEHPTTRAPRLSPRARAPAPPGIARRSGPACGPLPPRGRSPPARRGSTA